MANQTSSSLAWVLSALLLAGCQAPDAGRTLSKHSVADFSGRRGEEGKPGRPGKEGRPGAKGDVDPKRRKPGGRGETGERGEDGHQGGPGRPGPQLDVEVRLEAGPEPMLQVRVTGSGVDRTYRVDPRKGSLLIRADGGRGGEGGKGGRGGRGGPGGKGLPEGSRGWDGPEGRKGEEGRGGDGGTIRARVAAEARPWMKALRFSCEGGRPRGWSGRVQIEDLPDSR